MKREIVHIVLFGTLLGLVLVLLFGRPSPVDESLRVVISESDLAQMRAGWAKIWQRDPTPTELKNMIGKLVHDEVLYREAVRLGYDRDDPLIRHTLKLKMEYLGEAQGESSEPDLEAMKAWYAMRKERYRVPGRASLMQVYVSTDKHGDQAQRVAREILAKLTEENPGLQELSSYGDRFLQGSHYPEQDLSKFKDLFGPEFAQQLNSIEQGRWQGPVQSSFGLHLVKVYDRKEPRLPDIKEIEHRVRSDIDRENRKAAKELAYTEILRNYQVEYTDGVQKLLEQDQ